jgi:hypothetical protein
MESFFYVSVAFSVVDVLLLLFYTYLVLKHYYRLLLVILSLPKMKISLPKWVVSLPKMVVRYRKCYQNSPSLVKKRCTAFSTPSNSLFLCSLPDFIRIFGSVSFCLHWEFPIIPSISNFLFKRFYT